MKTKTRTFITSNLEAAVKVKMARGDTAATVHFGHDDTRPNEQCIEAKDALELSKFFKKLARKLTPAPAIDLS